MNAHAFHSLIVIVAGAVLVLSLFAICKCSNQYHNASIKLKKEAIAHGYVWFGGPND